MLRVGQVNDLSTWAVACENAAVAQDGQAEDPRIVGDESNGPGPLPFATKDLAGATGGGVEDAGFGSNQVPETCAASSPAAKGATSRPRRTRPASETTTPTSFVKANDDGASVVRFTAYSHEQGAGRIEAESKNAAGLAGRPG